MKEVRQIDLHLPRGWNDCTTRELEMISAAMLLRQQSATRLRPFDWAQVKVDVVLAVNDLDVRGQVPGSNNLAGTEPARDLSPVIPIGLKGPDTKGVQTYLPLKDYMRLMQQKTLRKQNIAQIAGEAIIDWLDRQEQKNA